MAIKYGYLVDPNKQFQYKNGQNLTSGYLRVFDANTDDPAPTYSNWQLTPNPQNITLDDNGRAVVICDSSKSYRLEVFSYDGELLWTIEPLTCMGGGGSSVSVGVQDIISTDQSVQVDIHNGIADLSADRGDPQVIVTASNTLTEDGQFTFTTATSRSGDKLNIRDGQVVSARQYIHFEATVALAWTGAANASTEVSLTCLDTTEKRDFDLSFAHTEYLDVSADYEVSADNTPLYVTVLNLYPGMTATVENFSVHAVTKRYGDGSEYRAGNGILIQAGEISVDPTTVQEKLEAGSNISIVGNVISATAEPQQDAISDLSTIRSGAAAGATAVQDPDYVHTDNNFTTAEKTKLSGIEAGAQVNVNADWNAASGTDAYIANKPQNLVQDASYVHTDENFTSAEKTKLAGIEAGAEVNVKPDWNAAAGSDAEILNRPSLATVATTGAFSDLSGKPTVDQTYDGTSANAQSGVAVAQAISGVNAVPSSTSADSSKVLTVNSIGTPEWAAAQAPISAGSGIDITNNTVSAKVDGTTVTVNGSGQLQATQPTVDQTYNSASANAQSGTAVAGAIAGKEDEFSAGDGLEFTTDGQGNRVLQVDTPVDIVAGPGIVIDNPDGNTLRVSVAQAEEVVLWDNYTFANNKAASVAMTETPFNFSQVRITFFIEASVDSWATLQTQLIDMVALDSNTNKDFTLNGTVVNGNDLIVRASRCSFSGTAINVSSSRQWYSGGGGGMTGALHIYRIVGIHRIANN